MQTDAGNDAGTCYESSRSSHLKAGPHLVSQEPGYHSLPVQVTSGGMDPQLSVLGTRAKWRVWELDPTIMVSIEAGHPLCQEECLFPDPGGIHLVKHLHK